MKRPAVLAPELRWPLLVAGIALALRVVYVLQARAHDPLFYAPDMDELYHHQWAISLARGLTFIRDAYFRAPLYPFFLGLVYKLFGPNLLVARLIQAVLGSLSCALLYLIARRLFAKRVAVIAGLVMAAYPLAIFFDGELLISSLLIFLLLLSMLLWLRSRDLNRQWYLPGLAFGLASITRPNTLAVVAAFAFWLLLGFRPNRTVPVGTRPLPQGNKGSFSRRLMCLVQFLAGVTLVVAPVTIRNYIASRRFVLIAWQGGTNFYIGNNPLSDGTTAILPGTRADWWGGYYDAKRIAEQARNRELKGAEIDAYWLEQGLKFWHKQPTLALGKLIRKCYLWLSGTELSNNRDTYFFKHFSFLNFLIFRTSLIAFPFGLLLPLALVGVYLSRRESGQLLPLYLFLVAYSLSFVIFFVTDRYRLPVVLFLIPFAALVPVQLYSHKIIPRREQLTAAAIFVSSFLVFNPNLARVSPPAPAQNYFALAKACHDRGQMQNASKFLQRAVALDSAPNIMVLDIRLHLDAGRIAQAERAALAGLRLYPNQPEIVGMAGNVFARTGRTEIARHYFQRAAQLDPYSVEAWHNLGISALELNQLDTARKYLERALTIDPYYVLALFHLGLIHYYQGNKPKAQALWRRVLELEPANARAQQALRELR